MKPDGSRFVKPTVATSPPGTDGVTEYVTETNLIIDKQGTWKRQPHVINAAGKEFHGEIKTFDVEENL